MEELAQVLNIILHVITGLVQLPAYYVAFFIGKAVRNCKDAYENGRE